MKKTVYKKFFIWEYDKEEKWLNEMSAKGWQLIKVKLFKYTFEQGTPNEYIYRLELLDKNAKTKESKKYIDFLKETDIETVGTFRNWIYLRKKAADGNFDDENKIHSTLTKLFRVDELFQSARNIILYAVVVSFLGILIIQGFIDNPKISDFVTGFLTGFFTGFGIGASVFSVLIIPMMRKNRNKIKQFLQELSVNEGI